MTPPSRPLRHGDRVAVVAPAGPFPDEVLARGLAWLRARCDVPDDPRWRRAEGYLAAPDADRAAMLLDALADPDVRALVAVRGGYGAMRALEHAGPALLAALARHPKPLVGYSDVTALHALWVRAGVRSVHAVMLGAIGRGAPEGDELWDVLRGAVPAPWEGLAPWCPRPRDVTGRAAGGNLALLAALSGTPWAMDLAGAVLFLEDVTEKPYRLDRMLTTLRLAGALRGVRAVVLGDFVQCDPAPDGVTAETVLRERLCDLGVPVVAGAPFGHGDANRAFVLGAPVTVTRDGAVVHREGLWGP